MSESFRNVGLVGDGWFRGWKFSTFSHLDLLLKSQSIFHKCFKIVIGVETWDLEWCVQTCHNRSVLKTFRERREFRERENVGEIALLTHFGGPKYKCPTF